MVKVEVLPLLEKKNHGSFTLSWKHIKLLFFKFLNAKSAAKEETSKRFKMEMSVKQDDLWTVTEVYRKLLKTTGINEKLSSILEIAAS